MKQDGQLVPDRFLRAADFDGKLGEDNNPEWKTVAYDETSGKIVAPNGSIGFRWGEEGKWNLEEQRRQRPRPSCKLSLDPGRGPRRCRRRRLPLFRRRRASSHFTTDADHPDVLTRNIPVKTVKLADGESAGRHGVRPVLRQLRPRPRARRRLGRQRLRRRHARTRRPGPRRSPACRPTRSSTSRASSRGNAEKTNGKSMVIIGAGDEPLVPHGHELSRHHQHAGDVRLRRPVRRRLGALCGPGKAAPADRLAAAGLRARLEPSAAAHELDLVPGTPTPTSGATRR